MFAQFKKNVTKWWHNQIKVLPTQSASPEQSHDITDTSSSLVMMLPRTCYFETYKTYPLSVGRDINKIAKIDGRQISPYGAKVDDSNWVGALVIKQPEQYVVYYFALLPKYKEQLTKALPVFIIPESAMALSQLAKGKIQGKEKHGYRQDENGVWLSDVTLVSDSSTRKVDFEHLSLASVQAFFNPNVVQLLKSKVNRWQQVKFLSVATLATCAYLLLVNLYLGGLDWYLNNKNQEARPIISELFKAKDALSLLQKQQQEFAHVYTQPAEISGALTLIEQYFDEFELDVKTIEINGSRVRLQATATNANGLLEQLLTSENITEAEFKSDIKKVGKGQSRDQFELEFLWSNKLWNSAKQEQS